MSKYRTKVFKLLPNLKYLDETDARGMNTKPPSETDQIVTESIIKEESDKTLEELIHSEVGLTEHLHHVQMT